MTLTDARSLLESVAYLNWKFLVFQDGPQMYLQVQFFAPPANDIHADLVQHQGRKWRLSTHMTRSEIVQTALLAVKTAEEHEVREHFLYRGRPIFGPHHNVDDLVEAIEKRQLRQDEREDHRARPFCERL